MAWKKCNFCTRLFAFKNQEWDKVSEPEREKKKKVLFLIHSTQRNKQGQKVVHKNVSQGCNLIKILERFKKSQNLSVT